ncbi:citrate lyase acyl carrier protein [Mobilicoccus pelagius]|uniref:Citrate lyase acyl carrier protein n=1 Tax=Mobilicoccus pelagius NBRC 104925 TaxID=1089455 RepID=H5UQT9_9MICO|nr:citrate lyase acyl carrier protein [Mobilicoccus pelagius]GAB48097.1 citrate lyase acyl carrier protein [Mobilicoccus pelagius NBRC 104925]
MRIVNDSLAGTLESSDAVVRVSPHDTLEVTVVSTVEAQFGAQIRAVVADTLDSLDVRDGRVVVEDKGALDCTLRARVQAAVMRASDDDLDWSAL